jgi:hypothetical protein
MNRGKEQKTRQSRRGLFDLPFPARNEPRKKAKPPRIFSEAVTGFGTLHRQAAEAKGQSASGC